VAKVGTSNPDRKINLKRMQCVAENKNIKNNVTDISTVCYWRQGTIVNSVILFELDNTDCKWGTTVALKGKSAPVPTQHVTVQVKFTL
jgi:hypothetical protein